MKFIKHRIQTNVHMRVQAVSSCKEMISSLKNEKLRCFSSKSIRTRAKWCGHSISFQKIKNKEIKTFFFFLSSTSSVDELKTMRAIRWVLASAPPLKTPESSHRMRSSGIKITKNKQTNLCQETSRTQFITWTFWPDRSALETFSMCTRTASEEARLACNEAGRRERYLECSACEYCVCRPSSTLIDTRNPAK